MAEKEKTLGERINRAESGMAEVGVPLPSLPNLYQRLARIAGEIKGMHPTGKTAQGVATFSISDIEDVLRPLFARHGVVVGYTWNGIPTVVEEFTRVDRNTGEVKGSQKVYQCDLTVWLVNADMPEDKREDRVIDFASSPSGAVSFALKRYYRALFHLAEEEANGPEVVGQATPKGPARPATSTGSAPPSATAHRVAPPAAPPVSPQAGASRPAPDSAPRGGAAEAPRGSAPPPAAAPVPPEGGGRVPPKDAPPGVGAPAAPPPEGPAADHAALVASVRMAGRNLKSPATDASLMAMARGKWKGQLFRRLEDLTAAQLEELNRALSSLVDLQNSGAPAPPEQFERGGKEEDVPF